MSLQDIVNVQITRETKAVSRAGFSTINILGVNKAFPERIRYYSKLSDVLDDFRSVDEEYIAAQAVFAQSPSVTRVAISRRETSDNTVITVATVANSTEYTCTINGTEFSFTSDADATALEIAAGLVAAINLGSEPVTATDNTDGTYDLDADVAGVAYSVKTDSRQTLAFTTSNTPAEDLAEISEANDDWYGLVYTKRVEADILLIAEYIEGVRKVYGDGDSDDDIINIAAASDTSSIPAQFKALAYARSFSFYHVNAATVYPEAAALGSILPLNPGSYTLKFKTLTGIAADDLSSTQRTNALAKNCNIQTEVGGVNIVENGNVAEGEWVDIIIFIDWLEARITEEVYGLLVNQPKVPYTDAGIAAVEAEITGVLQQGQSPAYGGIAPDDGSGGPGFTVTVPAVADISAGDKAARTLNDVLFDAILAGAIHAVNIQGTVTV
jgi:hypothetical protein